MKKLILSLAILLFVTAQTFAQLTANAGPNQTVCEGTWFSMGGSPTATGGTPPYTYSWAPSAGLNNNNVANPQAFLYYNTNYSVIVTDSLGVHDTAYASITLLSKPSPYILVNDTSTCTQAVVNLSVQVQNGHSPFTYAWDFGNGGTSNVLSPVTTYTTPGSYQISVTVTDSNNCTGTYVLYESVHQLIVSTTTTNVSCFGGSNGTIVVTVSGGFPPYTYAWSNGMTTASANNMPAGSYNVTITDSHGCVGFGGATLTQPAPIAVATTVTNESNTGTCDGSISAVATGGVGAYTYYWSNTVGVPLDLDLCHGTYYVTVTDANACTATAVAVVGSGSCSVNTLVVSINSQDLTCAHQVDTMTVNVSGGTPPYSFNWNNGAASDTIITDVGGLYLVYVSDDSGCVKTAIDTLLNSGVNITLQTATPGSCNGTANGYIKVHVTGGVPPYTYLWNTGDTGDTLANIHPGYYSLTVTDTQSCIDTFGYYLPQTSTDWSYYIYATSTYANCGNNGTATAWVYGGTSPFAYLWSNADTTPTITGLAAGNYTVTVTGSDGCMRIGSTNVIAVCYNTVDGFVFNDANHNCVRDSGEAGDYGITVSATGTGGSYYGYTDNSGYYHISIPASGNFTISASANGGSNCSIITLCGSQTASFTGVGDSVTLNFGITSSTGFDLALHPGWHTANPGFTKDYWVLYYQQSVPIYTGPAVITFKYDSILIFNSCNNSGVNNAVAHTITWNVSSVPYPNWDWITVPRAYFTVPANLATGYQLSQEFWITPVVGDCDSSDNHLLVIQPVTGSRDPNEKVVSPEGDIQEDDSVLTYSIHFQNTGNDTTSFITVKDTLSSYLNPATVVNVASSHEYSSFDISGTGILTWVFNPIFLVDSFTNEPASKGFVMFRVKKKPNLPLNTQIKNQAHVYFDYNEPVATNTVMNTLTNPNNIFNVTNDAAIQVTAAPNPFTQQTQVTVEGVTGAFNFELFDVSGKLLQKKNALTDNRFTINREGVSAGIYFYSITTNTKQKAFGRLVVE